MTITKTRFAPSPTGLMHIGNARTALFSALAGQSFLLRIEDTDAERSRREFVDELLADLRWLGLIWQEGPDTGEPCEAWFQSQRSAIYQHHYDTLERQGNAYPCFCSEVELEVSRKVQLAAGKPPRYSGKCGLLSQEESERQRAKGRAPTLRFRVPKGQSVSFEDGVRGPQKFQTDDIGDFIIRRADGTAAFFFCNAIDDALMGVTEVIRGEDHLANTPRQLMILQALGLPQPGYAHSALILGDDGAPLSKRNGSRSIGQLREEGYFATALLNMMARLGHHYEQEDLMDLPTLRQFFSISHLGKSPARFDPVHLNHWQSLAIRQTTDAELRAWLSPHTLTSVPGDHVPAFLELVRSNCLFPGEADQWARILFTDEPLTLEPASAEAVLNAGEAYFRAALDAAGAHGHSFEGFLSALKETTGKKGKALFMPLRAALTGRHDGPELAFLYGVIAPHRIHRRLAELINPSE